MSARAAVVSCLVALGAVAAPAIAASPAPAAGTGLEGTWRGELGERRLRLVLSVSRQQSGGWQAVLDSLDQGASLSVDTLTVEGDTVRFEVVRVHGAYQGTLDRARETMTGTWTQGGSGQPLSLTRAKSTATDLTVRNAAADPAAHNAPAPPRPAPLDAPVDVFVPNPPAAFRADGRFHVAYELHVTNFGRRGVTLDEVDMRVAGAAPTRQGGVELARNTSCPGAPEAVGLERLRIGPGMRAVVFVWLDGEAAPGTIEHQLTVRLDGLPSPFSVAGPRLVVATASVPSFGPPLRGGDWQAGNGPANTSAHRRALIPIGGRARISQRFAIDFVRLGPDGKTFSGRPDDNRSYLSYGSEALAVADGVVATVKDGIAENTPGQLPEPTLEKVAGNHVILDLGGGRYAFYAHLQPGSLRVVKGQRVRRGQVLGLVGNSGNSTEPHLHFHVSDANSPLAAEGLPYAFDSFAARPAGPKKDAPFVARASQLPTEDEVVRFP